VSGLYPRNPPLIPEAPDAMTFSQITVDPRRMGGVPCIRDLRIPVATGVDVVAGGIPALPDRSRGGYENHAA